MQGMENLFSARFLLQQIRRSAFFRANPDLRKKPLIGPSRISMSLFSQGLTRGELDYAGKEPACDRATRVVRSGAARII